MHYYFHAFVLSPTKMHQMINLIKRKMAQAIFLEELSPEPEKEMLFRLATDKQGRIHNNKLFPRPYLKVPLVWSPGGWW